MNINKTNTHSISEELAQFITNVKVPEQVNTITKKYLLDWIGSTIAGSDSEPAKITRKIPEILGGLPQATIISNGVKTSLTLAAFANAASAHVVEMDDLDRGSVTHPGAPIISTALAIGEYIDCTLTELLEAISIGYEICIRTGEALGTNHYEKWHTTGTAGTLGCTAAAARLMKLDTESSINAIGTSGTMAAGLWQFLEDGAMSKQLHPAKAAHDGILSVLLAKESFTGARKIFEGKKGLLNSMSNNSDANKMNLCLNKLESMPEAWKINNVSFKVHSSCRHTHAAVDAAIKIATTNSIHLNDIESVSVEIYSQALGLLDGVEPFSPWAAKFSLPFCVATGLIHKDCSRIRFTKETIGDEKTILLANKISFKTKPEFDEMYPIAWPSTVTVTMYDGSMYYARIDYPSGDPETNITESEIIDKFKTMVVSEIGINSKEIISLIFDESIRFSIQNLIQYAVPSNSTT